MRNAADTMKLSETIATTTLLILTFENSPPQADLIRIIPHSAGTLRGSRRAAIRKKTTDASSPIAARQIA